MEGPVVVQITALEETTRHDREAPATPTPIDIKQVFCGRWCKPWCGRRSKPR